MNVKYRRDCFWYTEIKDMNATIPECIYKNTPYECDCTVDCLWYIEEEKARALVKAVQEIYGYNL